MNIEHNATAGRNLAISTNQNITITADNIDLSTAGRLIVPTLAGGSYLDYNPSTANLSIASNNVGGVANPSLSVVNTSTTAGSIPVMKFDRPNINSSAGDGIAIMSFNADDATGTTKEWGRISAFAQNVSAGNQDGRIGVWTAINGATPVEVFNFNGADNENNSFRPLDLNGNNLKTSTGNLTIDTTASNGAGTLTLSALQSVNINAGGGFNLSLTTTGATGRLAITTLTSTTSTDHNVNFCANSNGLQGTNYLKVLIGGVDAWIPYLTTDPTLP
jgi:hypothetical protein